MAAKKRPKRPRRHFEIVDGDDGFRIVYANGSNHFRISTVHLKYVVFTIVFEARTYQVRFEYDTPSIFREYEFPPVYMAKATYYELHALANALMKAVFAGFPGKQNAKYLGYQWVGQGERFKILHLTQSKLVIEAHGHQWEFLLERGVLGLRGSTETLSTPLFEFLFAFAEQLLKAYTYDRPQRPKPDKAPALLKGVVSDQLPAIVKKRRKLVPMPKGVEPTQPRLL